MNDSKSRKTIEVGALLWKVNYFLKNSKPEQAFERQAHINFMNSVLHDTENYKGFGYLEYTQETVNGEVRKNYGDETRIEFYVSKTCAEDNPAAVKTMKAVADRLNVIDVVSLLEIFHDLQADLLEHGREYHHVTPKDLMDRLNKAIEYLEQETA
jgi:hypothetical protein